MLRNEGDQVKVKFIFTSAWTFMVKEDSIAGKHVVSFSVVYNNPVSIYFGSTCQYEKKYQLYMTLTKFSMSDELLPVVEHDNHTDQILKMKDLHSNPRNLQSTLCICVKQLNCFVRLKQWPGQTNILSKIFDRLLNRKMHGETLPQLIPPWVKVHQGWWILLSA